MSDADFPNVDFLFNRAKQCQSIARTLADPKSRNRMIDLARSYEEIARSAEKLKIKREMKHLN